MNSIIKVPVKTYQVQANGENFQTNIIDITDTRNPQNTESLVTLILVSLSMKKPSIAPYITEAMLNPTSTNGLLEEVNNIAPPISIMAQKTETILAVFILVFFFIGSIQSTTVADAKELIDELNVDIAAAKIPATRNPVKPLGR
jgi:hypothetical protein